MICRQFALRPTPLAADPIRALPHVGNVTRWTERRAVGQSESAGATASRIRLAPSEYRRGHTSYFATDGDRHPVAWALSANTARPAMARQ